MLWLTPITRRAAFIAALVVVSGFLAGLWLIKSSLDSRLSKDSGKAPGQHAGASNDLGKAHDLAAKPNPPRSGPAASHGWPPSSLLTNVQVVAARETSPDAQGRFIRTRLVKASFKYPLVRVEETLTTDAATGAETVLHRIEMVGDHIMVKLRPGVTEQDLTALTGRLG